MKMKSLVKAVRMAFADAAFPFRMGAGFAGDVNRTHPVEIEPVIQSTTPAVQYGQPVLIAADGTNGIRPYAAADQSNTVASLPFGFLARPYPLQQQTATNYGSIALGAATPPGAASIVDVCRAGLIMGQLNTGVAAPVKGGAVYVWCAATSGNHIQGGLETAASAGNTVQLDPRYTYNGPADANGIVEISANI